MKPNFQLNQEELLVGEENFENWFVKISNAMRARKLLKYIKRDVLLKYKDIDKLDKKSLKKKKRAEAKAALASDIIFNNVTKDVFEFIKRDKNAYLQMKKLKKLFKREKSFRVQNWMNKLNSIKANDVRECANKLNQITEIFKLLDSHNYLLGNQEKLRLMYKALPDELQEVILPPVDEDPKKFYKNIIKKTSFKIYTNENQKIINQYNNHYQNENQIYNVEKYNNNNEKYNDKRKFNSNKHCEICDKNGHSTRECKLNPKNPLSRFHKDYIKYKKRWNKYKNQNNKNKNEVNAIFKNNDTSSEKMSDINEKMFVDDYVNSFRNEVNTATINNNKNNKQKLFNEDYNTNKE